MPRIDPQKLLNCLSVLLAPNGGILSSNEVKRLTGLMAKFSKKLVSKCIYIQILKCTETDLLGQFMSAGGWSLSHNWLTDGILSKNWPLVQEILELLLLCPVDVQRLKSNTAPKLVKQLSKEGGVEAVRILATKLVEQWLKIVKGESMAIEQPNTHAAHVKTAVPEVIPPVPEESVDYKSSNEQSPPVEGDSTDVQEDEVDDDEEDEGVVETESPEVDPLEIPDDYVPNEEVETSSSGAISKSSEKLVYKITVKDGKQVLAKVEASPKRPVSPQRPLSPKRPASPKRIASPKRPVSPKRSTVTATSTSSDTLDGAVSPKVAKMKEIVEDTTPTVVNKPVNKEKSIATSPSSVSNKSTNKDEKSEKNDKESDHNRDKSRSRDKDRERDRTRDERKETDSSSKSKSDSKSTSSSSSKRHHSSSSSHRSSSTSHRSSSKSSSSRRDSNDKDRNSSSSNNRDKDRSGDKDKDRSSDKEKDRSGRDRERSDKDKSKSSSSSSSRSKSSSSSNRDKERSSDPKSSSEPKVSQADKDKDTLSRVIPPSINKLGKIPRKASAISAADATESTGEAKSSDATATKKASISIEVRKDTENRPKTVKTFNSQFRSHGLAEEAPPPPSRRGLKKPSSTSAPGTAIPAATINLKRQSVSPPPIEGEKRFKLDSPVITEKPGAIKLIAPKPKPSLLLESDMFMDALSAATTTKKEAARKRKRKDSASGPSTPDAANTPTSPMASSLTAPPSKIQAVAAEKTANTSDAPATTAASAVKLEVAPLKFYQDTLTDSEVKDDDTKTTSIAENKFTPNSDDSDEDDKPLNTLIKAKLTADDVKKEPNESVDDDTKVDDITTAVEETALKLPGPGCGPNGPPGVLIIHRRKGPKKQLRWRPQEQLEEVRFFELDENERVNVTKTFVDMKQMERSTEREGFMMARKTNADDLMTEQIPWSALFVVDDVPTQPDGGNSTERQIQIARELNVLKALYFNKLTIPDSPAEPNIEHVQFVEPQVIPLEDITGNPDAVTNLQQTPWPESRGSPPLKVAGLDEGIGNLPFNDAFGSFPFNPIQKAVPGPMGPGMWPMDGPGPGPGPMGGPMNGPMGPNGIGGLGMAPPMFNGMPMNGPPMEMMNGNMNNNMNMGGPPMNGPPMNGPPMNGPPMKGMHNFGPNGPNFNGPPQGFNNFNGNGPMHGNENRGRGGGGRGGNNGGGQWFGPNGPPSNNNWRGGGGGMGGNNIGGGGRPQWMQRNRICKSFQKGYCRNGDKCNFLHPGINCPLF